jgi:hypothetical protein
MFSKEQAQIDGSDREPEDRHDAVHRLVLPTYCAASVSRIVPVTRTGGEKNMMVILSSVTVTYTSLMLKT